MRKFFSFIASLCTSLCNPSQSNISQPLKINLSPKSRKERLILESKFLLSLEDEQNKIYFNSKKIPMLLKFKGHTTILKENILVFYLPRDFIQAKKSKKLHSVLLKSLKDQKLLPAYRFTKIEPKKSHKHSYKLYRRENFVRSNSENLISGPKEDIKENPKEENNVKDKPHQEQEDKKDEIDEPIQTQSQPEDLQLKFQEPPKCLIPQKKRVGLKNLGNTCFMNSVLQCLLNSPLFPDYFLNDEEKKIQPDCALAYCFKELIKDTHDPMDSPNFSNALIRDFHNKFCEIYNEFKGFKQQDALQFFKLLLETLNEELNRVRKKPPYQQLSTKVTASIQELAQQWYNYIKKREDSIVTDMFWGQILNETSCEICHEKTVTFDNYWDLSLGFGRKSNLHDQIKLEEMIENFINEGYVNDSSHSQECAQGKIKIRSTFWTLPKILTIHFKRFKASRNGYKKISSCVVIPKSLVFDSFIIDKPTNVSDCEYSLFGLIHHYGTLTQGHYTAECFDFKDQKWICYNDEYAEENTKIGDPIVSGTAYMLFYIKTSIVNKATHFSE